MDDTGEWFCYHPLFGNFLRQRCQWELAAELPEIHRAAAESWMACGFPSEAIHHALAAGDALMLRDILLNHARSLFNHSELSLLEESLKALPWDSLLENPQLVLLQAWLMQSQHRYGEVNTLLARAEHEIKDIREDTMHAEFNALRARWRLTMVIRMKRNGWQNWHWKSCRRAGSIAALWQPRCWVKCCTAKAN